MLIPNMLEITKALRKGIETGCSSQNLFSEEATKKAAEVYLKNNPEKAKKLKEMASDYRTHSVSSLRYSSYRQFDTTGERNDYQAEYFERRDRLTVMGMCTYLFEEDIYREETENIIWAICEEYTWCLPAHLGGRSLEKIDKSDVAVVENGKLVSTPYSHRYCVDLFACETARELAETLYLLGNRISTQVRDRAVQEIADRVLGRYMTFNGIHHFEIDVSNWSAVCGGSIGVTALYLSDDEKLLAPILQKVISDLDVFLSSYGEDGIGCEGIGYWNYGFSNFCYFAWLLKLRTGNTINLFEDSKVGKIAEFSSKAFLFQDYCVNFSDCSSRGGCSKELFCLLREMYPNIPVPTSFSAPEPEEGERYVPITLRKILWEKEVEAKEFLERSEYYPDAGWLVSCKRWKDIPISFVVKGGNNAEPHNQNDLGHFIMMLEGEQLLCDLGNGEYTKDYFGAKRYQYLVNSSRGHSVPIIDGVFQKAGADARAEVLLVNRSPEMDEISLQLATAYPVNGLNSLVRNFCIYKDSYRVIIRDRFEFENPRLCVKERFVSLAEPVIEPSGDVSIIGKSHSVKLSTQKSFGMPQVEKEEFRKPGGKTVTAWLIDYTIEMNKTDSEFCLSIEIQ